MDSTSITQLCIDLPESGLMHECRRLAPGIVTVHGKISGPYQLHITCDDGDVKQRRFLCAVIDANGRECGEFAVTCAAVMKTMRGLYLRLSEICAYHLQQAYYKKPGAPAPITHEAIPEAGSAADQIAPLLPGWLAANAQGRRQLHRCLFDVLGVQMGDADHNTLLEMMGIAPAAEAEQHIESTHSAGEEFSNWHPIFYANDQGVIDTTDTALADTSERTDIPGRAAHYHGLISRAMN